MYACMPACVSVGKEGWGEKKAARKFVVAGGGWDARWAMCAMHGLMSTAF